MRTISPWDITALVNNVIKTGKSHVEVAFYASPRLVSAITVGKDHNHLPSGHYVLVDHEIDGQQLAVSIKIVPIHEPYDENRTVTMNFIGHTLSVNDSVPCVIFQLEGKTRQPSLVSSDAKPISWSEQDASNS